MTVVSTSNGKVGPVIDYASLRRLSGEHHPPAVTSVYLDVDGRDRPRPVDVDAAWETLARRARRAAAATEDAAIVRSVAGDLERVGAWLAAGFDRAAVRGLAFFSCAAADWFEVVELAVPVADLAVVAGAPHIRPLEELRHGDGSVLLALVDRQHGRLVRVHRGDIVSEERLEDPVDRQVDEGVELGGWDRQSVDHARRHLQRVADRLFDLMLHDPAELALAGTAPATAALERLLHPAVRERLAATLTMPVAAGAEDIKTAAGAVLDIAGGRREAALVREITERSGGHGAVAGLADTLVALDDHRVRVLALSRGFAAHAARCPGCARLGIGSRPCPRCGTVMVPLDDAAEAAIEAALQQGAEVTFCAGDGLDALGGIAALERY